MGGEGEMEVIFFFGVGPHCPMDLETSKELFFLSLLVMGAYTASMGFKYNAFIYLCGPLSPFRIMLYKCLSKL